MVTKQFTATLLRASAHGFASLAVSRTAESIGVEGQLNGGFEAWQSQFRTLVLELAAAVDDGGHDQFATKVCWTRDAFMARGMETEILGCGLTELSTVLEESLPSAAWAPLPEYFETAQRELARCTPVSDSDLCSGDPIDELVSAYLSAVRQGDGKRAIALVLDAIADKRISVSDALACVLTRASREMGRLWHADEVNVAQEHFATQTTGRLLEQILVQADKSPPTDRTVILTMVQGDAHDLGLRIVAAFFELAGWRTICLGADTPAIDLARAAQDFNADLVLLGATLNTQRKAAAQTIKQLKANCPDLRVIVGGAAFAGQEARATEIGADGCSLDPQHAVSLAQTLLED